MCTTVAYCGCARQYLRADWILDANHSDADKVGDDVGLILPVGLWAGGQVPVGHADGAEAVTGHGLDHVLHHLVPVPRSEGTCLPTRTQDGGTSDKVRERERRGDFYSLFCYSVCV